MTIPFASFYVILNLYDLKSCHMFKNYPFETSMPYMCVPACLNMIFARRALKKYPQEELGYKLGLTIPPSMLENYPKAKTSTLEKEFGVHPQNADSSINLLFKDYGIPLDFHFMSINEVPSSAVESFLIENLNKDNDIIIGYDYLTAFGEGGHFNHTGLVADVLGKTGQLVIIDPEEKLPIKINTFSMLKGIRSINDGFWLIGKKADFFTTPF